MVQYAVWLVGIYGVLLNAEFAINAKNDDGNVVREVLQENVQESYITLEYTDWDLTKITQLIDFKSGFSIYKVVLFGELDLGQPSVDTLCFVNHVAPTEFIEPESVSKLRQVGKFISANNEPIRCYL